MEKIKVKVKLHAGETVVHQCAHAALNQGKDLRWFRMFLDRAERAVDLDQVIKCILSEFDISADESIKEDL